MDDVFVYPHQITRQPDMVALAARASEVVGQPVHGVWIADQISEIDQVHHEGQFGLVDEDGHYLDLEQSVVDQLLAEIESGEIT